MQKVISTTLYTIDDHPQPEHVFDWMRANSDNDHYAVYEIVDTLKAFCTHYDIQILDWSISAHSDRGERVDIDCGDISELHSVRLWKYINNNYSTYFNNFTKKQDQVLNGNCPFTGVCWDENALDPMRDFMKKPDSLNYRELMSDCIDELISALHRDSEYRDSDEAIREDCICNDYYFDDQGAMG